MSDLPATARDYFEKNAKGCKSVWLHLLPKVVAKYNNIRHTTTEYKPKVVTAANT